jgi:hypothetical protein
VCYTDAGIVNTSSDVSLQIFIEKDEGSPRTCANTATQAVSTSCYSVFTTESPLQQELREYSGLKRSSAHWCNRKTRFNLKTEIDLRRI